MIVDPRAPLFVKPHRLGSDLGGVVDVDREVRWHGRRSRSCTFAQSCEDAECGHDEEATTRVLMRMTWWTADDRTAAPAS